MSTVNNKIIDNAPSMIEIDDDDDDDEIIDDTSNEQLLQQQQQQPRPGTTHVSRASLSSSATGTSTTSKRQKDISPCYVCGAKAHGYNFDQS